MPSDLVNFRIARSPQRTRKGASGPGLQLDDWLGDWDVPKEVIDAPLRDRQTVADEFWGDRPSLPDATSVAELPIALADRLDLLDQWLTWRNNRPDPQELVEEVRHVFDRDDIPDAKRPGDDKDKDGDGDGALGLRPPSLGSADGTSAFAADDPFRAAAQQVAQLLVTASLLGALPTTQRQLTRAALLLGLVELMVTQRAPLRVQDVEWALRRRQILLPKQLIVSPLHSSVLARRPGVSDLYVVRQEWNRYVAGEIAHVENVLTGEFKERVHTRTDETEVTVTLETETTRTEERDIESTQRFELNEGTATDTELAAHVEGQIDTSGQYGPTKVETHLGGSLDYSRVESEERATQMASEIVARAVLRVEERVREERTTRTLTRIEERNTHRLDNDTGESVVGMYRWIDKIMRLQKFVYADRFLLEFQVPEPAAYLRWLEERRGSKGFNAPLPAPLTLDGKEVSASNPILLPTDISENVADSGYYLSLAGRYHAQGITAPPPKSVTVSGWLHVPSTDPSQDKTAHDVWITPATGSASGAGSAGGVEGQSLTVPDGYSATSWSGWVTTQDQDDAIKPAWLANTTLASFEYVPPSAFITVGDSQNDPAATDPNARNLAANTRGAVSKPISGALSGRQTGVLPITVLASNYGLMSVQVHLDCIRDDAVALLDWQIKTYELLRAAYFEMLRAHEEEQSVRDVRAGVQIAGRSPLENTRIIREELKRQVIEMLLGQQFLGVDAVNFDVNDGRPSNDLDATVFSAPLIQFLEQVFEWENLTYVFYPYYWADAGRWDDLQPITSEDPDYARFLRSGSARVVLSARPGYASAVEYYIATGLPWTGGPAPLPDDSDYISVADEIGAQTGGPDEGKPFGSSWEVRLPTTLLALDTDPSLPKKNDEATIPPPTK